MKSWFLVRNNLAFSSPYYLDEHTHSYLVSQHIEPPSVATMNDTTIADLQKQLRSVNWNLADGAATDDDLEDEMSTSLSTAATLSLNKTFPNNPRRPPRNRVLRSAFGRSILDSSSASMTHRGDVAGNITVMETHNRNVFNRVSRAVSS